MQINIDNGMLISTFIGAIATLAGAFGGTYWAAKLNNDSKQKFSTTKTNVSIPE